MVYRNLLVSALGLFLCASACGSVWAAEPVSDKAVLDEPVPTEQALLTPDNECRFVGRFTQEQRLQGVSSSTLSSNGRFLYDCEVGVIWEVQQPVTDSLVLRLQASDRSQKRNSQNHSIQKKDQDFSKRKSKAFRVYDGEVETLKGRQSQFLTRLIMSLMSADQTALESQFDIVGHDRFSQDIDAQADSKVTLTPKKRALKRAIKQINVSRGEHADSGDVMDIEIVDRNEQTTSISAHREGTFADSSVMECARSNLSPTSCELLFAPQ